MRDSIGRIYLCKPNGVLLGAIEGVTESTARLKRSVSSTWELSFEVQRYISVDGELHESSYYQSIGEMMELFMSYPKDARFVIDAEPSIVGDGVTEKKTITAHSIEAELSNKLLKQFKVNCGTKDSQEYLVGYYNDEGDFVNVNLNPYTNLPVDYIVVWNNYAEELTTEREKIAALDLRVSTVSGLIQNKDCYEYLHDFLRSYPRIECDPLVEGGCNIYLHELSAENEYGYELFVGSEEGTFTQEYLLTGIDNLINYYQTYGKQLSMLDLAIEKAHASGWTVGNIPIDIAHKKYNFDIDKQDILSFFKSKCTQTMKVIFDFDRYDRRVNIIDIANTDDEHDTGVFLSYRNLVKQIDIKTSSQDGIRTKFVPTGNENLGVLYANFGEYDIVNLNWFMDKINEYGENQYVTAELHDKYHAWEDYRYSTPVSYDVNGTTMSFDSRRDAYRELTKKYNQYTIDIDAIKNKLPNDGCSIDYTTFTFKELNIAYKAYFNALETLEQLYMSDVGAVSFDRDTLIALDGHGNECTSIKDTFYWLDFCCYYYTIIPNVINALRIYVKTDEHGTMSEENPEQYDAEKGEWIENLGGNPWYNGDAKRVTENMSDEFMYDMSLYGTVELAAKKKAWQECAATLYKVGYVLQNGVVVEDVPLEDYEYNTPDETGWNRLSDEQKQKYTSEASFERQLNEYLNYVSTWVRENALTHGETKGVIQMAQDALDELQPKVDALEADQARIDEIRKQIASEVTWENWEGGFTEEELEIMYTLVREADYTNNNILITSLDDIATTVDAQEELYVDATTALYERSRPQLTFDVGVDNLFAIPEFECMADSVDLLNYIRVSIGLYDDEFVRLRVTDIEENPLILDDELTLKFSNMTYTLQGVNDLANLFNSMNGTSTSSSSGSSNGSSNGSGTYGNNDAQIQIANNMLNALLKSKTYTNSVSQTVVNQLSSDGITKILMAGSGLFDKLESGDLRISGECLVDYIKSLNWNDVTKEGSIIRVADGTFSLGNAKLTWDGHEMVIDGSVRISGHVIADFITSEEVETQFENVFEDLASAEGLIQINGHHIHGKLESQNGEYYIDVDNGEAIMPFLRITESGATYSGELDNATGTINHVSGSFDGTLHNVDGTATDLEVSGVFKNSHAYTTLLSNGRIVGVDESGNIGYLDDPYGAAIADLDRRVKALEDASGS